MTDDQDLRVRGADWMRGTRRPAVQDAILEIAGEVFATKGANASMGDIAAAVGCSRATLYRYFDGRRQLQLAYIERVARRIGAVVAETVSGRPEPADRLTESIVVALTEVRRDPALAAWFTAAGAGVAGELALSSEFIETVATAFLGTGGEDGGEAARWVVRVIVSLLAVPEGSPERERAVIARFVTPTVLGFTETRS